MNKMEYDVSLLKKLVGSFSDAEYMEEEWEEIVKTARMGSAEKLWNCLQRLSDAEYTGDEVRDMIHLVSEGKKK